MTDSLKLLSPTVGAPVTVNPATGKPPRWKMAVISWAVAFPLIQLLGATLAPLLSPLPGLVRGALVGAAMVTAMTYWFMPLATRLAARWLYPAR